MINKTRKYFDVILAHTGRNYDYNLNGVFFKDLKLKDPEVYMDAVADDLGPCGYASYKLMVAIKPDAVLVLDDTNSCLSVIGAKRLHIPIFHMEAGNRCKDEGLPEETNRRIVDIISDVNMAYSEHARRYLADCGIPKEYTCVTGSPNISKPGITKCEHWHHTKWEQFIVVSGHGLIQLRKEGTSEVLNYEVSGDKIQSVIMLPGYTHNIINLSDTDDLITVMYCNEIFNPEKPDTFFDKVVKE